MAFGLTLHESVQAGVLKIHALSQEATEELLVALGEADLAAHAEQLSVRVAERVNTIPRADVDDIIDSLSRLCQVSTSADVALDEFTSDVYGVMSRSREYQLQLSPSEQEAFKDRLRRLLSTKAINVVAKTRLVFIEHEHYLCYARVMTDMRPIFGENVEEQPLAATIVHSLKIAFHVSGSVEEFFVAVDAAGLERLGELIERAKKKAKTLEATLKASGVRYIDVELD